MRCGSSRANGTHLLLSRRVCPWNPLFLSPIPVSRGLYHLTSQPPVPPPNFGPSRHAVCAIQARARDIEDPIEEYLHEHEELANSHTTDGTNGYLVRRSFRA